MLPSLGEQFMNDSSGHTANAHSGEPAMFSFAGPYGHIEGTGAGQPLPRGAADTFEQRLTAFASATPGAVIGGALPFAREDHDYIWQARRTARAIASRRLSDMGDITCRTLRPEPSAAAYASAVEQALRLMGRADIPPLNKVVLARTLAVEGEGPIPQDEVFRRIAQDTSVTAFRVMLPDDPQHGLWTGRALIGATPELLVEKSGAQIASHPLAGSARRSHDPEGDRRAREGLEASDKDRREHMIVVEYIFDLLAPYCRTLSSPQGTTITATRSMWHLGTRIEGVLRDGDMPSALLASILHPTPAVCGFPCARAAALIRELEPVDRKFYAGAVGWCDLGRQGDGAWFVSIRCADICGPHARLYAGAGIVPGSDPLSEAAETGAKFGAMLRILGLPIDAGMPPAQAAAPVSALINEQA